MKVTATISALPESVVARFKSHNSLEALNLTVHSSKPITMLCECGVLVESTPKTLTRANYLCKDCNELHRRTSAPNNLVAVNSVLLKHWDFLKNPLPPENFTEMSGAKAWFIGESCGHSFETQISSKSLGVRCPVCKGRQVIRGVNDLGSKHPKLAKEWHPTRNGELSPYMVSVKSNRPVWWLCELGHEWIQKPLKRSSGYGCGKCSRSQLEKDISALLDSWGVIYHTNSRKIIKPYELDFVMPDKKLAIEANGKYWHSNEEILRSRGVSAKDFHAKKLLLASSAGYELAFVWEDDWLKDREKSSVELKAFIDSRGHKSPRLCRLV